MINLNECKFGDKLRTKDGRMAVFLGYPKKMPKVLVCAVQGIDNEYYPMFYSSIGRTYYEQFGGEYDIEGKWEDEV